MGLETFRKCKTFASPLLPGVRKWQFRKFVPFCYRRKGPGRIILQRCCRSRGKFICHLVRVLPYPERGGASRTSKPEMSFWKMFSSAIDYLLRLVETIPGLRRKCGRPPAAKNGINIPDHGGGEGKQLRKDEICLCLSTELTSTGGKGWIYGGAPKKLANLAASSYPGSGPTPVTDPSGSVRNRPFPPISWGITVNGANAPLINLLFPPIPLPIAFH